MIKDEHIEILRKATQIRINEEMSQNLARQYTAQILVDGEWKDVCSSFDKNELQRLVQECKKASYKKKTFAMKNYDAPQAQKQVPPVVKKKHHHPPPF